VSPPGGVVGGRLVCGVLPRLNYSALTYFHPGALPRRPGTRAKAMTSVTTKQGPRLDVVRWGPGIFGAEIRGF